MMCWCWWCCCCFCWQEHCFNHTVNAYNEYSWRFDQYILWSISWQMRTFSLFASFKQTALVHSLLTNIYVEMIWKIVWTKYYVIFVNMTCTHINNNYGRTKQWQIFKQYTADGPIQIIMTIIIIVSIIITMINYNACTAQSHHKSDPISKTLRCSFLSVLYSFHC